MTADALQQITSDALDTLARLLDQGHSEQLTTLLKTMARFHHYSWHNVCLIASQRPTATRVAGFQTWRSLKRHVRKGEKGIAILAPILGRRDREGDVDQTRVVVGFRAAYVFDVLSRDSATRTRQRRRRRRGDTCMAGIPGARGNAFRTGLPRLFQTRWPVLEAGSLGKPCGVTQE